MSVSEKVRLEVQRALKHGSMVEVHDALADDAYESVLDDIPENRQRFRRENLPPGDQHWPVAAMQKQRVRFTVDPIVVIRCHEHSPGERPVLAVVLPTHRGELLVSLPSAQTRILLRCPLSDPQDILAIDWRLNSSAYSSGLWCKKHKRRAWPARRDLIEAAEAAQSQGKPQVVMAHGWHPDADARGSELRDLIPRFW